MSKKCLRMQLKNLKRNKLKEFVYRESLKYQCFVKSVNNDIPKIILKYGICYDIIINKNINC